MRLMDLILAFPIYLLAIILMAIFTSTAGVLGTIKVTGAIAIVRIPIYARLVRGSVLSIREKEYIARMMPVVIRSRVEDLHIVGSKVRVGGHDGQSLDLGLGDQESIERVAMVAWQVRDL